jgi:hypothetical protein
MIDQQVWVPILRKDIPREAKIIPSFMFLKEKFNQAGDLDKIKARLVAGGNVQDHKIYGDVSSPTADLMSVFIIFAIAAGQGRSIVTADIKAAYLNAPIEKELFIKLSKDLADIYILLPNCGEAYNYVSKDGSLYFKLSKALYGCIESAQLWFREISKFLGEQGFISNAVDPCVFHENHGEAQLTVVVYVDDLIITSIDVRRIDSFIIKLQDRFKNIKTTSGLEHFYLGMLFTITEQRTVKMTMDNYVKEILLDNDIQSGENFPSKEDLLEVDLESPLLVGEDVRWFHSTVAKLLYLSRRARPDVSFHCNFLSTRVRFPTEEDKGKLYYLLRFIYATRYDGVIFGVSFPTYLQLFADASFASHPDGASHSGVVISLGVGPIFSQSRKMKMVVKSICEAETIAISEGLSTLLVAKAFLDEQLFVYEDVVIAEDNSCAIELLSKNSAGSMRTRFIRARYSYIKQFIDQGIIKVVKVRSGDQVADPLTKARARVASTYNILKTGTYCIDFHGASP